MKKKDEKNLERASAISQKTIGVAVILVCTIISNHQLFKGEKSLNAKPYLTFALVFLVISIICGLLNVLVISFDFELSDKKFNTFSASRDKRILWLQVGSLLLSILFLFFILLDTI